MRKVRRTLQILMRSNSRGIQTIRLRLSCFVLTVFSFVTRSMGWPWGEREAAFQLEMSFESTKLRGLIQSVGNFGVFVKLRK